MVTIFSSYLNTFILQWRTLTLWNRTTVFNEKNSFAECKHSILSSWDCSSQPNNRTSSVLLGSGKKHFVYYYGRPHVHRHGHKEDIMYAVDY